MVSWLRANVDVSKCLVSQRPHQTMIEHVLWTIVDNWQEMGSRTQLGKADVRWDLFGIAFFSCSLKCFAATCRDEGGTQRHARTALELQF